MSDHDALLRAIVENPDDDTVRLVFADWLDEHADVLPTPAVARSRAAFIRDDIAMSLLGEFDPQRLRWDLIEKPRREGERWASAALPELPNGLAFWREPLFRRGFPWAVRAHAPKPPDLPAAAFPLERALYAQSSGFWGVTQLLGAPWRRQLRAVEFERGGTGSIGPRRLFAADGLDRLERLALRANAVHVHEVRDLFASPMFGRLSALEITETPVGVAVSEALATAGPARLRELHLTACRVTPAALEVLLAAPAARNLEALSAGGDRIGAPEKFRVFGRSFGPPLRALNMSEDSPKEAGLEALLGSPLVPSLQRLALANCNLNGDRTRLLASGAFSSLRALNASHNPVGNEGAAALARSPHLAGLRVLNLGYSQVGDEGVLALLESPLVDGLVFLDLVGSPASAETKELLVGRMGDRVRVERA